MGGRVYCSVSKCVDSHHAAFHKYITFLTLNIIFNLSKEQLINTTVLAIWSLVIVLNKIRNFTDYVNELDSHITIVSIDRQCLHWKPWLQKIIRKAALVITLYWKKHFGLVLYSRAFQKIVALRSTSVGGKRKYISLIPLLWQMACAKINLLVISQHVTFCVTRILQLKSAGLINLWETWYIPTVRKCTEINNKRKKNRLSLNHLSGAFLILAIGSVCSLVAFLVEKLFSLFRNWFPITVSILI